MKWDAMSTWLDLLQWPAMLVTVLAAWWIGALSKRRRAWGFWLFLLSNALWMAWGWYADAYALIVLQVCLAAMNCRGLYKNDRVVQEAVAAVEKKTGSAPDE
jgi:hypothetical protein